LFGLVMGGWGRWHERITEGEQVAAARVVALGALSCLEVVL
jgi:hypothetical protein